MGRKFVDKLLGVGLRLLEVDIKLFTDPVADDIAQGSVSVGGLEDCGVILNTEANAAGGDNLRRVSSPDSRVAVWVVTAQEDRMIAVHVGQMEAAQQ